MNNFLFRYLPSFLPYATHRANCEQNERDSEAAQSFENDLQSKLYICERSQNMDKKRLPETLIQIIIHNYLIERSAVSPLRRNIFPAKYGGMNEFEINEVIS